MSLTPRTLTLVALLLFVGCAANEPEPKPKQKPVKAAAATPTPTNTIVIRGKESGTDGRPQESEYEAQERADRLARAKEYEAQERGDRLARAKEGEGDLSKGEATTAADHIADLRLIHEGDKLLIQFSVANKKGDRLAIPGRVSVWIYTPAIPAGRPITSFNGRNWQTVTPQPVPKGPDKLAIEMAIQPEELVDGLGRESTGYRVDALPWPRGRFGVRLVFTVSGTSKSLEAKAQDTD